MDSGCRWSAVRHHGLVRLIMVRASLTATTVSISPSASRSNAIRTLSALESKSLYLDFDIREGPPYK